MSLFDDNFSDFGGSDLGVTNNTGSFVDAPPDASGGSGSFLDSLIPTLTQGLSAGLNTAVLNTLGGNSSLYTVDANGNLVPKAAAGANNAAYRAAVAPGSQPSFLTNPLAMLAILAAGGLLIWAIAK